MQVITEGRFTFGEYELDAARRSLTRNGETISLYPKAFDVLHELVGNHGRVLTKEEILNRVWPGQFVEENNLAVQISALRKVFGDRNGKSKFIATVPGKGYSFVADVAVPDQSNDLVIENHEYSRIVVEDFLPTNGNAAEPQALTDVPRRVFGSRLAILGLIAVAAIAIGGGIFYLQFGGSKSKNSFYQNMSVRQLTTNGNVGMAALSPDGKLFAYTIDDLGQKSLWLGYVDGGNHLQLKPPADAVYRSLTFSPDNKFLFYSLRDDKNPKFALMRMPVPGGVQEKVLDDVGTFSLSPNGREIAETRQSNDDDTKVAVSIAPLDGSERRDVAAFDRSQRYISQTLSWKKDKTKLATVLVKDEKPFHTDLVVIDIATGAIETIKQEMFREVTKTAWLGDGSALVVTALEMNSQSSVPQYGIFQIDYPSGEVHRVTNDRSQYGASWHNDAGVSISLSESSNALLSVEHRQMNNIWLAAADELTNQRQLTFGSFGKYDGLWGLDWTPDGKLVYVTSDTESQYIAQMNADGSDQKQLTASGKVDSSLSVTADGKYIVFHSNRAPDFSIWRTDIDGSNARQLTSGGEAFLPTASPDGRWVYFKSYIKPASGWLCRVPFDGGEQECFTDKETSFASFSPDGRYIAATYYTDKSRFAIFSADDHSIVRLIDIPKGASPSVHIRWKPDSQTFTVRDSSSGYWNFPINGEPYKLDGFPDERFYNFSWSRDGKYFAFTRGQEIRDVVLFSYER